MLLSLFAVLSLLGISSASSIASTNTTTSLIARADCACGYVLTAYGNAYFPLAHITDFTKLPAGKVTAAQLDALGWQVSEGWQAGAAGPDGTVGWGSIDTFSSKNGELHMTVPAGYHIGQKVPAAEITFNTPDGVTGGVFTMNAQLDETWGTCQSIFTYKRGDDVGDEQDIEMIGQTIKKPASNGSPAGIQLTNFDPNGTGQDSHTVVPFPNDPTTSFNKYTIAWLTNGTKYYYNGKVISSPPKYSSVHPSDVIINHWSAGIEGFTEGPPVKDVVMKVKGATLYYKTPSKSKLPAGCSLSQACKV